MKKICLTVFTILAIYQLSFAQTNTFPSTGNVGIGTTTPQASLDINGNLQFSNSLIPMGVISEVTGSYNQLINLSLNFREGNKNINYVGGAMRIDSRSASPLFVWLSRAAGSSIENVLMSITLNGNVGIGTTDNANWQLATSPYKLAVGGSVIATDVTVKTAANWPDYVFKNNYQLPSLHEVKTYIDQNQHLPDMPSEQEVTKDGLNLGEMNKLLTKKVEELTLYLIEKDEKEKEQERINNKLIERLIEMEKKLNSLSNSGNNILNLNTCQQKD